MSALLKVLSIIVLFSTNLLLQSCGGFYHVRYRDAQWHSFQAIILEISDGDTAVIAPSDLACISGLTLEKQERVRLLFLDCPETSPNDRMHRQLSRLYRMGAYWKPGDWMKAGSDARVLLQNLCPPGCTVSLDICLDRPRDDYGRLLAVVFRPGTNINLYLVSQGAAEPYFVSDGHEGPVHKGYRTVFREASEGAERQHKGIWKIKRR